eukprot:s25_g3.t1
MYGLKSDFMHTTQLINHLSRGSDPSTTYWFTKDTSNSDNSRKDLRTGERDPALLARRTTTSSMSMLATRLLELRLHGCTELEELFQVYISWRGIQAHEHRNAEALEARPSQHAIRFRQLLNGLQCTEEQLAFVEGHRLRQMLRGVNAIAAAEPVALAFENLYEDLAPVRFACDVLFWRLERPLVDAAKHSSAVLPLEPETDPKDLAAARELFEILDREPRQVFLIPEDGSGTLDRDELLSNALLRSLGHCEGCTCEGIHNCRSVDRFMQELDSDGDGSITFLEFMLSASRVLFGSLA